MASQNERYQERLAARLRGARTRTVANPGFDLDLQATPESASPAVAPTQPAVAAPTPLVPETRSAPTEAPTTRRTSPRSVRTNINEPRRSVLGGDTPETRGKRMRQPSPDKFLNTPEAKAVQQGQQARALVNGDREARRQARLRGAGTRTVADVGFDIGGLLESPASPAKKRKIETPRHASELQPELERIPDSQPKPEPDPPTEDEGMDLQHGGDALVGGQSEVVVESEPLQEPEREATPEAEAEAFEPEPAPEAQVQIEDEEAPVSVRRSSRQNRKNPPTSQPASAAVVSQTPVPRPPRKSLGKKPPTPKISEEEEREAEEAERAALKRAEREAQAETTREARIARVAEKKARTKERAETEAQLVAEAEARTEARRAQRAKAKGKEKARRQSEPEPEPEVSENEVEMEDIDEPQEVEEDEETPPPQPKKTRKPPAQKRRDEDYAVEEDNVPRQRQPKDGIEILIHRFDKGTTIAPPPKSNRKGVNPADIVYTLLVEQIDRVYPKLQTRVEKEAMEIFKEELSAKLRQLTDGIENYLNLQVRNRQAIKQKLQLQQEILEIKRQRQLVAVQQDEVRYKHDNASKQNQIRQWVGSAYEGVTDLIERAEVEFADLPPSESEATAESGLDALIYRLAPLVTGGGTDGSGMLGRIVQFNRELEKLTELLKEHNSTMIL